MVANHNKWSNSKASGKYCTADTTREPNAQIYRGNSIKEARAAASAVAAARITVRSGSGWRGVEEWANGAKVSA